MSNALPPVPPLADVLRSFSGSEAKLVLLFLLQPDLVDGTPVRIVDLAFLAGLSQRSTQEALQRLTQHDKQLVRVSSTGGTGYRWASTTEPRTAAPPSPAARGQGREAPVLSPNPPSPEQDSASLVSRRPPRKKIVYEPRIKEALRQMSPSAISHDRAILLPAVQAVCPKATIKSLRLLKAREDDEERLTICLFWLAHEGARSQVFATVQLLAERIQQECSHNPAGSSEFQKWMKAYEEEQKKLAGREVF